MTVGSQFPLEAPCRLSRSVLWRLQRRFFERSGVAAWSEGVVPHHVTSNPALARAYGRVVLGFLRDWRAGLDPAQPVYIVELGAGAGRLGFHFVRAFERLIDGSVLRGQPWRYVLTDFAEANVAAWRAHPQLAGWLASGRLELARFDAERDAAIALEPSGAVLAPGRVRNPLVVIANYVFDGLPLDGFTVVDGRLHEWRVRLCSTAPDTDLDDPELLARVRLTYDRQPVDPAGYYGDPALDRLLDEHRAELPDTGFTFPSASLWCLARLADIAGGRMLVLSTDKGEVASDALRGRPGPAITLHGSFSIEVNYHAIARWFRDRGGEALIPEARPRTIATCALALGGGDRIETRQAYGEAIAAQSPDDRFAIEQSIEPSYPALTLDRWIGVLRFAECDPKLVGDALPFLLPLAGAANPAERDDLVRVVVRAWDGYLHIGEPRDLGFALGTLATVLGAWREAVALFEGSLRWYGPTQAALFELARCHRQLGELAAARARLDEALVIDPAYPPAIALAAELAARAAP
jgi:hypothetical protein